MSPLRRVLVANRGEIAVRVIRACRDLGIESVAVYSDADGAAPHVRLADRSVRIGPAPAAESYLVPEAILEAAAATSADAVHPGYGFLSERAGFARACEDAGLVFIGPAPETIAGLGDKLAARRAAAAAGVPVVPGTLEPASVEDAAAVAAIQEQAAGIGWPLMVKAAAGGGGRGMRLVEAVGALPDAVVAASREAAAVFGDGSVYLERFVGRARHVEVQLLGDGRGTVVALGERDCSVQRRHQKLVEEAPAPGLTREQRRHLHGLAVGVGSAFGLRSAATAEFLLSTEGDFWFLEVNTRLQVEHGVTELVSGLDIVHEQLRIAAGEGLSEAALVAARRAADPAAHAIEVRIGAEDPGRGFVPVTGRLARWREPAGPGVRMDSGVEEGTVVGTDYDPLLAKLLVVGRDRDEAAARLRRALVEFEVAGLQTTLPFHAWIAAHPAFLAADLSTSFVADHWQPAPIREAAARRAAVAAAASTGRAGAVPAATRGSDGRTGSELVRAGAEGRRWAAAGRREAVDRWPA